MDQSLAMAGCREPDDADSRRSRADQAWRPPQDRKPSPAAPLPAASTNVSAIVRWICPACAALPVRSARDTPSGGPPLHRAAHPVSDCFEDPSFDARDPLDGLGQLPARSLPVLAAIARSPRFGQASLRPPRLVPFPAALPLPPSNAAFAVQRPGCPVGAADRAPC